VAQVRLARAAPPCRIVRLTRSIKAVLSRPERPNPCKAASRASSVPRRITCVTFTSLRQRSAFLHLAIDQPRCYLPLAHVAPWANHLDPLTKVGCESIKVEIESVTGKERQAAWGLALSQRVDELLGHVLCAGTELKHRKKLRARIDGQPQKDAPVWRSAASCVVRPIGGGGSGGCGSSARVTSEHARAARDSQVVIVA
jgi:hypothetical protein